MRIILLGAPGSGKGVQGDLIVKSYKIAHLSTGNILRKFITEKKELGLEALKYMEKGLLVPDDLIVKIVEQELDSPSCENGFVMDGVPRTIFQAEEIEKSLNNRIQPIDRVIYLEVGEDTLVKRLTNRRTCIKCGRVFNLLLEGIEQKKLCDACGGELIQRVDDREETVRKRFQVYDNQTKPLLDFYKKRNLLVQIPGDRSVEDIFNDIQKELNKVK